MIEVAAHHRYARFSAEKGRLVANLIRGASVGRALDLLTFNAKRSAKAIKKVLESAIANAEHNAGADIDSLYVSKICVNTGPMLKRMRSRAKGRGDRIVRRSCHITVVVSDKKREGKK